ncbi:MAG: Stp1/IreP family PP2C-type Ser/Thr phosphatase [Acidobacteriota bacterium]
MRIEAFGLSDVGRQRQHNEDSFRVEPEAQCFVVADGMGGHAAGEVASKIAVDSIADFMVQPDEDADGTWPHAYDETLSRCTNRLLAAFQLANTKVLEAMRQDPALRGMGTTVVATGVNGKVASFVHLGDSRGYLIRDGKLSRVTNDHSWVFEQIEAGILTEEEAQHHPLRNVITRALGGSLQVLPEVREIECLAGDLYILCSDGLTGMVSEREILEIVSGAEDLQTACRQLVDSANEHGGYDNITAVVVRMIEENA